ncbi:hypothetical protein [Victivallis sp. Marseille-Q1083]|uniref:hypothetical protein n=1 Tax=Victivallis sp. Marseille-Q1083 TaxID=2717288 RepID=UPI00158F509B|nr:hypothetical protein [Victivallis sp. Marseille-Q1083]
MVLALNIAGFFLLQIIAALLFKWASAAPQWYWYGFGIGNLCGVTSILMLIQIYKMLHPNLAAAVCTGGSFLAIQLALTLVYRAPIGMVPLLGIILIAAGIFLMTFLR